MAKGDKLNPKQRLFVLEYLKDFNGSQAAIRSGYSKKTANRIASELLTKLVIRKEIDKELDKIFSGKRKEIQKTIIDESMKIVTMDMTKLPFDNLKKSTHSSAINSLKYSRFGENVYLEKVTSYDKNKAIETMMKYLDLYSDKLQIDGNIILQVNKETESW